MVAAAVEWVIGGAPLGQHGRLDEPFWRPPHQSVVAYARVDSADALPPSSSFDTPTSDGGDDITAYLEKFMAGDVSPYEPNTKTVDLGIPSIAPFTVPAEDRNRTSPFPYGGHRFEFRAVGSSQNVSLVNVVLCTIWAEAFKNISDKIEAGQDAKKVATELLEKHWRVIFNGNGYSEEWPIEAGKRGVWRIDSGVESISQLATPKNTAR